MWTVLGKPLSMRGAVVAALLMLCLGVLVGARLVVRAPSSGIPAPVIQAEGQRAVAVAEGVRLALNEAVADLEVMAVAVAAVASDERDTLLETMRSARPRYEDLAVVDDGMLQVSTGGDYGDVSMLPPYPAVVLAGEDQGLPRVLVSVPLDTGSSRILVARYAHDYLGYPLVGEGGVWLVDGEGRVVAANRGYIAGAALERDLPAPVQAAVSARAAAGSSFASARNVLVADDPAGQRIVSARHVVGSGPAGALGLAVLTVRPHSTLNLGDREARRQVFLFAGLAMLAAMVCLGWLLTTVVLPVGHLARAAERLADGQTRIPVVAHRFDEVGVVARHLEHMRLLLIQASGG